MKPKVIKNKAEYEAALARIEQIFTARPGTSQGDELELLSTLVELYEDRTYPMDWPDPLTAIRFRMEQQDLKQKDLVPFIGSPGKVSEVLSGRRKLSITMIRKLSEGLGIAPKILLQEMPTPALKNVAAKKVASPSLKTSKFLLADMSRR